MDVQKKIAPVAVKVCGVTQVPDILHCLRRQVGYVGFNFYPGSKRFLPAADAAERWRTALEATGLLATKTAAAAVLVAPTPAVVATAVDAFPALSVVQIHVKAPLRPAEIEALRSAAGGRPLWLGLPVATTGDVLAAAAYAPMVDLLLFDSAAVPPGATVAGGSGTVFDWSALAAYPSQREFGVAGGLRADNVGLLATKIRPLRPALIDLCSGVEVAPGRKDPALIDAVLRAVRGAW